MFSKTETDLQLVKKLYHRCVNAGLEFDWGYDHSPKAILRECNERKRYEYGEILKMRDSFKEQGYPGDTDGLLRTLCSLLEFSANASDEDLQAMIHQTNENRERFNYIHNLRLSPWAYLVYIAGRDRLDCIAARERLRRVHRERRLL